MKRQALVWCILLPFAAVAQDQPAPSTEETSGFDRLLSGVRDILHEIEEQGEDELIIEDPTTDAVSLSVRDAVGMALEQNPEVLRTAEDVAVFFARIDQARAQMRPQVGAGLAYTYQENADAGFEENFLTNIIAPGGTDVEDIFRSDRFSVEQLIFAGGSVRAAVQASRYLAQSEQWRRAAILDALEFETKRAYYDCLAARAFVVVAADSVVTFERHLHDAELMLEVGETARYEVIRAETELRARQTQVEQATNREKIAYTILRRLLNLPQDTPIVLTDTIAWLPLDGDRAVLTDTALTNRPEIHALHHAISSGEYAIKQVKGTYWPRVAAAGEWVNRDGAGSFVRDGWTVNLGAELDIYAGGRRKAERKEAEYQKRSLEFQLEEVKALIEAEVVQSYIRVQDAIARIRSEDQNVDLANEGLRLAVLRFSEGIGTQADVLDAQLALTNAQSELVSALREYAVAHAALERALGESWQPRDFEDTLAAE